MDEISLLHSAGAILTLLLGGVIKGTIGFGLPLFVVTLLSNILPIKTALAIVTLPIVASNLWLGLQGGLFVPTLKRFWPVITCAGLGVFAGSHIAADLDQAVLLLTLGCVIIGVCLIEAFGPFEKSAVPPSAEKPLSLIMGLIGGVLGGLSTIFGPPLLIYLNFLRLPKERFVAAIGVIFFCTSLFLFLAFGSVGILSPKTITLSALAILPVFAGQYIGNKLRTCMPQRVFQRIVLIFLLLLGMNLVRRALFAA
jgi:hypothetical protein